VSLLLRDSLPDSWQLWDNLMLDSNSDIDHVLVGPNGIFIVSTKSQRGLLSVESAAPTMNGRPVQ